MSRLRRLLAGAVCALTLGACADDPFVLEGSLGEFYPLSAELVRARLYTSELSIEFVRAGGEVPVRVTVSRASRDPDGPGSIDLGDHGDVTGSAEGNELPPFVDGTLNLDSYRPEDGAKVSGSFDVRFRAGSATVDLNGEFDTVLDVVE